MFEAGHIVPLAAEAHWIQEEFDNEITIASPQDSKVSEINSIQNGMLLSRDLHALFDAYDLSINPDV